MYLIIEIGSYPLWGYNGTMAHLEYLYSNIRPTMGRIQFSMNNRYRHVNLPFHNGNLYRTLGNINLMHL